MKRTNAMFWVLCAGLLLFSHAAWSQAPPQAKGHDPIGENFFPPELVMAHQQEIGITPEQKASLREELRRAQLRFTDLQWNLQDAMENLVTLVKQDRVDEQAALAQLDKVLAAEREIKRTQIALVIHIKNTLTPQQQARLRELRAASGGSPQPPGEN